MKRFSFVALLAASTAAASWGAPAIPAALRGVAAPQAWLAAEGPDAVAATAAAALLALLAGWVALALLVTVAAALPGAAGRVAGAVARRAVPAALYRLAAGATGLGVALSPVTAGAATPPPVPAPVLPATPTRLPPPALPALPPRTAAVAPTVTVAPGDSLWRIAAAHLPRRATAAAVAAAWPRWYAANRAVIGPDPSLLQPGQVLHTPEELR